MSLASSGSVLKTIFREIFAKSKDYYDFCHAFMRKQYAQLIHL